MTKYKIAIIDDEDTEITATINRLKDKEILFEELELIPNKEELAKEIIIQGYDSVLIDFSFSESRNDLTYDGVDLFEYLKEKYKDFPAVVLTNQENNAQNNISSTYNAFSKKLMINEEYKKDFLKRTKKGIDNFQKKLQEREKQFKKLLELYSQEKLTINQKEELINLDNFLEETLDGHQKIPFSLKKENLRDDFKEVIEEAKNLIEEIKTKWPKTTLG